MNFGRLFGVDRMCDFFDLVSGIKLNKIIRTWDGPTVEELLHHRGLTWEGPMTEGLIHHVLLTILCTSIVVKQNWDQC